MKKERGAEGQIETTGIMKTDGSELMPINTLSVINGKKKLDEKELEEMNKELNMNGEVNNIQKGKQNNENKIRKPK